MSYMNSVFPDSTVNIQELNFDEIEEVGGGPVPFIAIPIAVGLALLASEYFHHH